MPERIFADTNLFLRYLTNDLPDQADAVDHLLQRAEKGEISLVTNAIVVAEIIWTLESFYQFERSAIKERVTAILNTPGIDASEEDVLLQAVNDFADKNVDFADAYSAAWAHQQGIKTIATFDRKHFARLENLDILVPEAQKDTDEEASENDKQS